MIAACVLPEPKPATIAGNWSSAVTNSNCGPVSSMRAIVVRRAHDLDHRHRAHAPIARGVVKLLPLAVAAWVPLGQEFEVGVDDQLVALHVAGAVALPTCGAAQPVRDRVIPEVTSLVELRPDAIIVQAPVIDRADRHAHLAADDRHRITRGQALADSGGHRGAVVLPRR